MINICGKCVRYVAPESNDKHALCDMKPQAVCTNINHHRTLFPLPLSPSSTILHHEPSAHIFHHKLKHTSCRFVTCEVNLLNDTHHRGMSLVIIDWLTFMLSNNSKTNCTQTCMPLSSCSKKRPRDHLSPAKPTPLQPSPADASAMKAERKRFMSGKTSDVHRAATPQQQPKRQQKQQSAEDGSSTKPSRGDFLTMQREVQMLGETHCF